MRYFFSIIDSAGEIPDPDGTELPSEEAAQAEARIIVSELLHEFPDRFGAGSVVEVVADDGRRIMAIPITRTWRAA